jgi:chromosome partitioning protein
LTDHIATELARSGTPVAATRIGNRVALVRAMMSGLGVVESESASQAAAEIRAFADEVRQQ